MMIVTLAPTIIRHRRAKKATLLNQVRAIGFAG
jgi:hypothetical protein